MNLGRIVLTVFAVTAILVGLFTFSSLISKSQSGDVLWAYRPGVAETFLGACIILGLGLFTGAKLLQTWAEEKERTPP